MKDIHNFFWKPYILTLIHASKNTRGSQGQHQFALHQDKQELHNFQDCWHAKNRCWIVSSWLLQKGQFTWSSAIIFSLLKRSFVFNFPCMTSHIRISALGGATPSHIPFIRFCDNERVLLWSVPIYLSNVEKYNEQLPYHTI